MTKNPDTDPKVLSLPNAEPQTPKLDLQSAANWLAGFTRLQEIKDDASPAAIAEKQSIHAELSAFIGQHAPNLVHAYLQCAAILQPIQAAAASLIVPAVAKALADRFDTAKNEQVAK